MLEPNNADQAFDITVAIPTYNGAGRIGLVLEHLKAQVKATNLRWEVLVVDNNSQDNIVEVIKKYQSKWSSEIPLRYCFELRQGAAFARQKAIKEADSELIGFLDDDNLPEENWLSEAVSFSQNHPEAGAFSGRIYGQYESPPPEGFEKIKAFLAIRDHGPKIKEFEPENLNLPPGASLVVRKKAWTENVPKKPNLTGKIPGLFIQGDDYEPLIHIYQGNWKILYNPELKTHHQIPASRFEKQYLTKLSKGCGLATYQLKCINASPQKSLVLFFKILLGNLRRIVVHWLKYRNRIDSELDLSVFWEFYWGSFMSPFVNTGKGVAK